MNLHGIVASAISAVNPLIACTWRQSTGFNTVPDGTRVPNFQDVANIPCQVQALSYTDLMKTGSMNIEGIRRKVYMKGNPEGIDRQTIKGGDLLVMPDLPGFPGPTTWLVAQVLEHWPDWCSVAATLQNGS